MVNTILNTFNLIWIEVIIILINFQNNLISKTMAPESKLNS